MIRLSERIYNVLSGVVETFPVIADIEDRDKLPNSFAIYKIKEAGKKTKDGNKTVENSVSVMLVCEQYDEMESRSMSIKDAVLSLQDRNTLVTFDTLTSDFDGEDRVYVSEINFIIKTF